MTLKHAIKLIRKNKYILTLLCFVLLVVFFDRHSIISRRSANKQLQELKTSRDYYRQKLESDKNELKELTTNKENIERFAREQFYMRRANEELFVIVKEAPQKEFLESD